MTKLIPVIIFIIAILIIDTIAAAVIAQIDENKAKVRDEKFHPQIWKPRKNKLVLIKQGQYAKQPF